MNPLSPVVPVQEQIRPISVTFDMDTMKVDETNVALEKLPLLGPVFRRMFLNIADRIIRANGIKVEFPYFESLPELDDIDFNYISKIQLERVVIKARSSGRRSKRGLSFLKALRVDFVIEAKDFEFIELGDGGSMNEALAKKMLIPYGEDFYRLNVSLWSRGKDVLGCDKHCLTMRFNQELDWTSIVKHFRNFRILISVDADKTIEENLILSGDLTTKIWVNIGF